MSSAALAGLISEDFGEFPIAAVLARSYPFWRPHDLFQSRRSSIPRENMVTQLVGDVKVFSEKFLQIPGQKFLVFFCLPAVVTVVAPLMTSPTIQPPFGPL